MRTKALLGVLFALVALGVTEAVLRAIYSVDALLFEWERPSGLIATSLDGGIVARPNTRDEQFDGPYKWHSRINDLGFREDAPIPREKAPGTRRLLALGDSWIYGFSVQQGKTIPDVLEALLPAKLGVGRVEVINASVFGSSAFDSARAYHQLATAYDIDGVLIGTPHNTARFREQSAARTAWYARAQDGPASTFRTYLLVRFWLAPLRAGQYARAATGAALDPEIADIRMVARDARARGLPVWFAELPNNYDEAKRGFAGLPAWREALQPEGVFTGGHNLADRACWGFRDLGHPSESGAYAIAARMADVIAAGASIPVGAEPRCGDVPGVGPQKAGWAWDD